MLVIAGGAIATVPPTFWRGAEDALRRHVHSFEAMARPAAERSADWFERQTHRLRERFGGVRAESGTAWEVARKEESVRIVSGSGALTGSAR